MDNCKKFRDLILTDYIDAQLDIAIKTQVEEHLHECASCKAFAQEVKTSLVVPFEKVTRQEVHVYLWQEIEEKIQQQQNLSKSLWDLIQGWMEGITFPKLVPAVCSLAMLVFIGSAIFFNQQIKQAQNREQGSYLAYVLTSEGSTGQASNGDLGTPIEKYFL